MKKKNSSESEIQSARAEYLRQLLKIQKYIDRLVEENTPEADDEFDAHKDDKLFYCDHCTGGRAKKGYQDVDVVLHLRDEHDVDPDNATIEEWTDRNEKALKRALKREQNDEEDEE